MFPELRMIIGAAAGLAGCCTFGAELESLPPIFAPRVEAPAAPPPAITAPSAISERTHRLLTQVVQEKAANAKTSTATPVTHPGTTSGDPGVIVMDKFVVRSTGFKSIETAKPIPPVADFLRHGVLFRSIGKLNVQGSLNFLQVDSHKAGGGGTAPNVELKLSIPW